MMPENGKSPWICHICEYTSTTTESTACSICYKIACSDHLRRVPAFNPESGLFELQGICLQCALEKT